MTEAELSAIEKACAEADSLNSPRGFVALKAPAVLALVAEVRRLRGGWSLAEFDVKHKARAAALEEAAKVAGAACIRKTGPCCCEFVVDAIRELKA